MSSAAPNRRLNAQRNMKEGFKLTILAISSRLPVHWLRVLVLRAAGARIGDDVVMYHGYQVRRPRGLVIGANSSIGDRATLDARGGLEIGERVNISSEVQLWTAQHDWRSPDFAYIESRVVVGDHVWIGPRAIVLPGSRIGDGVVVGAGSVVRGTLEPWSLYAGVPARRVSGRPRNVAYLPGTRTSKPWFW